jgi:hypothetical protein
LLCANKAEREIKLKGEALEYIAEFTYLRQLTPFQDNSEKK